jgi:hypothetical protein
MTRAIAMLALLVPAATARAQPPPYSLPWQLRPVVPANLIRVDDTLAFYGDGGVSNATLVLGARQLAPGWVGIVRLGVVRDDPPAAGPAGTALVNPALAIWYAKALSGGWRLAPFLGVTAPIGMGGGDDPDPGAKAARIAGVANRSAMDNAMFAVNDLTVFPGVGAAWIGRGLTAQAEVTVLQLFRVRGAADQVDRRKTNLTAGLHLGYFVTPRLSAGVDLRYQRWLVAPAAVDADPTGTLDETATAAIGVRAHLATERVVLRPGLSYGRGLDDPLSGQDYHIIQVDLPIAFR